MNPILLRMASIGLFLAAFPAAPIEAAPHRSPNRQIRQQLHGPQGMLTRNRYRPKIVVKSVQREGNTARITCGFTMRSGFIDRFELRKGLEVLGTVWIRQPLNRGTVDFTADLRKAGPGNHSLRIWGWQGRQGYQSVHGESRAIEITN